MEKFIQIQLSEIADHEGYSFTLAALTDQGRIFVRSNALDLSGRWLEMELPELNKE